MFNHKQKYQDKVNELLVKAYGIGYQEGFKLGLEIARNRGTIIPGFNIKREVEKILENEGF